MDGGRVQDIRLRAGDENQPPRIPEETERDGSDHRDDALEKPRIQGSIIEFTYLSRLLTVTRDYRVFIVVLFLGKSICIAEFNLYCAILIAGKQKWTGY